MTELNEEVGEAVTGPDKTKLELQKLQLEIVGLRNKNKWEDSLARYVPIVTVLITLIALLLNSAQFQRQQNLQQAKSLVEQQKDRGLRVQHQIRADTEQLLQFTSDEKISVSHVSFLLEDLKAVTGQAGQEGGVLQSNEKEIVTNSLINTIHYDCDFINKPRDVYFATTVINHWDDYSKRLTQTPNELDYVLYKYIRALRELHSKDPRYFERIEYNKAAGRYVVGLENVSEEKQFQHYGDLVIGFKRHLLLAREGSDLMKEYVNDFKDALHNAVLTEQLFADYIEFDRPGTSKLGTFVFSPSASRGVGTVNTIELDSAKPTLVVSLRVSAAGESKAYRASIFGDQGRLIYQSSGLKASQDKILTFALHSKMFSAGDYILRLECLVEDGRSESCGEYYFRVVLR